jgi:hypothetical protein
MPAPDGPPGRLARSHPKPAPRAGTGLNRDDAERMAIQALGFLAADEERLERFLALSGLDPGGLRAAAAAPGFLAGVLDHVCADEPALLAFAAEARLAPEAVARARALLSGEPPA